MTKTSYEQKRDENVKHVQEVFKSFGIPILAQSIREVISKKEKGRGNSESDNPESDIEYDPSSDVDKQSDTDDDYDDDLNNEVNTEVGAMVPGTRPQKKQKAAIMAAANQQELRTPIKLTRQSAAMPSPRGRPPPRIRNPLPPKNTSKAKPKPIAISSASQLQGHLTPNTSNTTETTSTVPSNPTKTTNSPAMSAPLQKTVPSPLRFTSLAMSSPGANPEHTRTSPAMSMPAVKPMPSPPRFTRQSAAMSSPGANPKHTPRPTITMSQSRQMTPATSINQPIPTDTSPGGQSSRQSNDINESAEQFDAANSEGNTCEGEPSDDLVPMRQKNVRKKTMGHGLEKMINRGKKLAIQVAEGKKRPDVPLQAAKLASETGVALRDNLPILTSWKLYQKDAGPAQITKVLEKVASRLDVDIKNERPSKAACTDIIKKGEKSAKNKVNRGQVQLHQKTRARSYIAHRYSLRPKYNNMEPDVVDFFGECMTSRQSGRTPLADEIYEQMVAEKEREPEEGEAQKSPSTIVAESLSHISHSSTFLPNIGVPRLSKTGQASSTAAQARLQAEFEARLQAERDEAARKQEELQAQLQAQQATLQENQSLLRQTQEEVKGMNTKFEETNALLRAILKLQKD
ncbi:unnamed protein product [Miscanthus lutarioriparius]|uniref:Uncharacterized protein n=1 Tax=Miscanthus lutarioriparius TaxID=422564 RepID=A0A811QH80_9POAL|nr:unnamed protein product [Miscanthus lutarioriparius]